MQHSQQGSEGMRLHALPIGQWATVRRVLPGAGGEDDALMLRLLEIGFVPGEPVRIMASAGFGRDPGQWRRRADRSCSAAEQEVMVAVQSRTEHHVQGFPVDGDTI